MSTYFIRLFRLFQKLARSRIVRIEHGQASVEYALVLLAAAVIATVLISWATNTNVLNSLFDFVVNTIQGKVK
jgi:Flp pilus assembly pilin Flp